MQIDAYASRGHYRHHLAPVWDALTPERRGEFYDLASLVPHSPNLTVVAASGDLAKMRALGRPVALMEHGCGLSYGGDLSYRGRVAAESPSYAGGASRDAVLFLHPGEHPAARDRARYPDARIEVVGSPRLDALPGREPGTPTLAVSFHWDTTISPETRSAFIYYRDAVAAMARTVARTGEFQIIGHAHPRYWARVEPWYERHGIEAVESFEEVCRRADIYAVDNSSTLYEFAATGRQVIVLNAPFYRRGIHHGPRFWDAIPGPEVDEPSTLLDIVRREFAHPTLWHDRREAAVSKVYAYRSGASARAAKVLEDWTA